MYAIYGNIDHQYTPNVGIYTIHGSYGLLDIIGMSQSSEPFNRSPPDSWFCSEGFQRPLLVDMFDPQPPCQSSDAMFLALFLEMQVANVCADLAIHTCRWDWAHTGGDDRSTPVRIYLSKMPPMFFLRVRNCHIGRALKK